MAKSGIELTVISMGLSSLYRVAVRVLGYGKVTYYIRQSSHGYRYGAWAVESSQYVHYGLVLVVFW